MTRKDYVKVAEIINKFLDVVVDNESFDMTPIIAITHDNLIDEFIEFFENDNPNFDADKFWEACTK